MPYPMLSPTPVSNAQVAQVELGWCEKQSQSYQPRHRVLLWGQTEEATSSHCLRCQWGRIHGPMLEHKSHSCQANLLAPGK
jgi:hypothetical protein